MNTKATLLSLLFVMLFFAADAQLATPTFSYPSGYYPDSIFVSIYSPNAGATFHYTTNGDEPTLASPVYTTPILMKSRVGNPNVFSLVPTNPNFTYPLNGYDASKANDRGWLPPYSEAYKTNILKAKAFQPGYTSSFTAAGAYFIDAALSSRFSFPVVSLSADAKNFFSDSTGIYVYGLDTVDGGNYKGHTELMVHFQLFETDGSLRISQYCGMKNHGGGGTIAPQKSLQIIARTIYGGQDSFGYKIFDDYRIKKYKNVMIRNGGHRPDCFQRDDLGCKMLRKMNLEVEHEKYVIVFINGEYWGIQTLKNMTDENYFADRYHFNQLDVVVMDYNDNVDHGLPGDDVHYINMRNFAASNNMTLTTNYDYMNTQMDVQNFIDYQATEIYFGNGDWPNNNVKFWRYRTSQFNPNTAHCKDGRWRWIIYDLDAAFGGGCSSVGYANNVLATATATSAGNFTLLLRSMLVNVDFKNLFINRTADLLNTQYLKSRCLPFADSIYTQVTPEVMEHVTRWRYPVVSNTLATRSTEAPSLTKWNTINTGFHDFITRRPSYIRAQYMNYFSLPDTVNVTVNVSDTAAGTVKISTLIIDKNTVGLTGLPYPWTGKYFTSVPVPLKATPRPGYVFVNWLETGVTTPDILVTLTSAATYTAVFAVDPNFIPYHFLYINELVAVNTAVPDEYGDVDNDWFEIYNPNNFAVDIAGYYVTDSFPNKMKYQFPSDDTAKTVIPAHGFSLLWAGDQTEKGPLYTNFKFATTGEQLELILPDGVTVVDSVSFGLQTANVSYGRQTDGSPTWVPFTSTTPGSSNNQAGIADYLGNKKVPLFVYPNPAISGEVLYFNKLVSFSLYNSLGEKIVQTEKVNSMNIAMIVPGVYYIKTTEGEIVKWVKL